MAKDIVFFTKEKVYKRLTIISWTIFMVFIAYCLLVSIIPLDIVTYKNIRQTVLNPNKEVKTGGVVNVEIDRCKNLPFSAIETKTYVVDEVTWELIVPYEQYPTNCGKIILDVTIPKVIPAGEKVKISRTLTYRISPFTTVNETWTSEDFYIVP